jgi:hypothetical protein
VIVLLSDGKENRPPYVSEILPRLRKEYRVHAVGLGGSINAALMQQIATDTHGEFLHTLDPDEVTALYREILALETDEEVVGHESGSFAGGEEEEMGIQEKRFPIVLSDSKATFVVGWKNPDVSLEVELVTPGGKVITPEMTRYSRIKSHVGRDTHVIYTLQRPRTVRPDWEGEWTVRIRRTPGSAMAAETYSVAALVRSSLRLKLLWDKSQYYTKDVMRLKAQVIDKEYVLKDGVKMTVRSTVPMEGYGTLLAGIAREGGVHPTEDGLDGVVGALDRLSETEWQSLYAEGEETVETSFEVGREDAPEGPATATFTTPYVANLKKQFRPLRDGIYTYRIKVEGSTASGARYTRVRTASKLIKAAVDIGRSEIALREVEPLQPGVLHLTFTPRDLHGNLVGPGRVGAIRVEVERGSLKGKLEDQLDGGYAVAVEAVDRPEVMALTIHLDDVEIPVPAPVTAPLAIEPALVGIAELKGKVEQLRFDERGNFLGFTLRTLAGTTKFPSLSSGLAALLAEALQKDLTVLVSRDEATGELTHVAIETP